MYDGNDTPSIRSTSTATTFIPPEVTQTATLPKSNTTQDTLNTLTIGAPIATTPSDTCDDAISLNPLSDKIMGDTVNATFDPQQTYGDAESFSSFSPFRSSSCKKLT
jgi:hypothetical protein